MIVDFEGNPEDLPKLAEELSRPPPSPIFSTGSRSPSPKIVKMPIPFDTETTRRLLLLHECLDTIYLVFWKLLKFDVYYIFFI